PLGEWQRKKGNWHLPYAAGVPGSTRFVYLPDDAITPTVLGLEPGNRYHAFYWEPTTGSRFDLGAVQVPRAGRVVISDDLSGTSKIRWSESHLRGSFSLGSMAQTDAVLSVTDEIHARDLVSSIDAVAPARVGLVLRYHDQSNYVAAIYSSKD